MCLDKSDDLKTLKNVVMGALNNTALSSLTFVDGKEITVVHQGKHSHSQIEPYRKLYEESLKGLHVIWCILVFFKY